MKFALMKKRNGQMVARMPITRARAAKEAPPLES
jgi:hypothetical protein